MEPSKTPSNASRLATAILLAAALSASACSDDATTSDSQDQGPDTGGDAQTDPDLTSDPVVDLRADPDVSVDPSLDGDMAIDTFDLLDAVDAGDGDVAIVEPEFQLAYRALDEDLVGITDLMGVALTDDRIYVTGLWDDTARVSFFTRDGDGDLGLPWCLHDGLGWPTGVSEHPDTGDVWVADMVRGLVIVTPPETPGDCGCDASVETPCDVTTATFPDAIALGGITIADGAGGADGAGSRTFVSGIDASSRIPSVWELVDDGGFELSEVLSSPSDEPMGLHLSPGASFLYVASSGGVLAAYRVEEDGLGVGADIRFGATGFPSDTTADSTHYYWTQQDPYAHPDSDRGGVVVRSSLDGFSVDELGAGSLVWPGGVATDGTEWYVADRATGLWGFF